MARILFRMLPETGHHNGTFNLARELQKNGHEIMYIAIRKFKSIIEANGFSIVEINDKDDIVITYQTNLLNFFQQKLKWLFNRRRYSRIYTEKISERDYFADIIEKVKPDLFLIDAFLNQYALQVLYHNIPFITVQVIVSTTRRPNIPPLNSPFIPNSKFYSKIVTWLYWQLYYLQCMTDTSPVKGLTLLSEKVKFPIQCVNFKNYSTVGFNSIPEINTSIFEFDFPAQKPDNCFYLGSRLLFDRTDMTTDSSFHQVYENVKKSNDKTVFCSFGSLSLRYKGHQNFLKKLVNVFSKDLSGIHLILCVEDDLLRREFRMKNVSNIHIFKRVPQAKILQEKIDVMINHGGINSISECILTNTPMLVYPGCNDYDQVGNAARVCFHRIGLRGNYRDSRNQIKNKIVKLITDPCYQNNLVKMRFAMQDTHNCKDINDLVNRTCQRVITAVPA